MNGVQEGRLKRGRVLCLPQGPRKKEVTTRLGAERLKTPANGRKTSRKKFSGFSQFAGCPGEAS